MASWILTLVIFSPLAGVAWLLLGDAGEESKVRGRALVSSLITAFLTLMAVLLFFDATGASQAGRYCLEKSVPWIVASPGSSGSLNVSFHVGVDGISVALLALTAFLTPLAIWASFSGIRQRTREYYCWMLALQTGMLGVFCAMDLLLFYVFFEFTLVPLYFIIGIWGGPMRRRAANKFFIYTLAGSVLTFAGVLYLAYFAFAHSPLHEFTFDLRKLTDMGRSGVIPAAVQWWLFAAFAAGFAIKVPLFPVHTWLPLAHTEAPTAGSVILAGVLLKLGTYGFTRLSVPMLPDAALVFAPFMATLAVIGIIYGALAAWVQDDVKKLVAYSSVSHLGFCMLGLFSMKTAGVSGSVMYMINHGLSTGALFLVVGMVYERYHTRDIHKIGGLAGKMPWMAFFLIVFTLSSIGLPGLNGFVGEFLVLLGTATSAGVADGMQAGPLGYAYVVPAATGIILGAVYMLWMCQRILFGPLTEPPNTPDTRAGLTRDLTRREIGILAPIAVVCLLIGVYPKPLLNTLGPAVARHILTTAPDDDDPGASALALLGAEALPGDGEQKRRGPALSEAGADVDSLKLLPRAGAWGSDGGAVLRGYRKEGVQPG
ncbi:MAG: NuoM family protein [Phycisphaerae bacterium]